MIRQSLINGLLEFLEDKTSDYSERVALGMKTNLGWNEFTYSGPGMLSRKVAHYLINGLRPNMILLRPGAASWLLKRPKK